MTITEQPADRQATAPPPPPPGAARLMHWSWAMVPILLVVWLVVATVVFHALEGPLGIREGEVLLMARSVAGWFAETGTFLVVVAMPIAGLVLGRAALGRGARWGAWAAIAVNAALSLLIVYTFVDDIHMTYFPSWW